MSRKTGALSAAAALLFSTLAVATSSAPAEAKICRYDHSFIKTTYKGAAVWIPTSLIPAKNAATDGWQEGGSQSVSVSDGSLSSRTKGSADTVGGGGGVNVGVANLSAKYDHQWSRSTTTGDTYSKTYSYSLDLPPAPTVSRMRQYRAGFKMKYLIVAIYDGSPTCQNQTLTRHGLLPTERRQTAFLIETYANRGKVKSRG